MIRVLEKMAMHLTKVKKVILVEKRQQTVINTLQLNPCLNLPFYQDQTAYIISSLLSKQSLKFEQMGFTVILQ